MLLILSSCSLFETEDKGYSKSDDLQFLKDIIEQNNLTETSSTLDYDNGDGKFEALELGNQTWYNDRLISLDLASPLPYVRDSNLYNIKVIPHSMLKADKLEYLVIHKSGLSTIPEEVLSHPSMKNFHLVLNKIQEIPENIYQMKSLEILALQGNEIKTVPSTLADCPKLNTLLLFGNFIEKLPDNIWDIKNLESFNISYNLLTELPDSIDKVEEFMYLDFAWNQITELPSGFENIKVRVGLDLHDNSLFCNNNGEIDSSLVPAYLLGNNFNYGNYTRDRQIYELQNCGGN